MRFGGGGGTRTHVQHTPTSTSGYRYPTTIFQLRADECPKMTEDTGMVRIKQRTHNIGDKEPRQGANPWPMPASSVMTGMHS